MINAPAKLSVKDKEKPFILIAAVVVGIILNRFAGGVVQELYGLVNVGLFVVIYTIMLFVEVKEVGQAFTKVKPTALALATNFLFTL